MKRRSIILLIVVVIFPLLLSAQNVNVDVNLNMKHSVNGVSDFGRERRMTIHSSLTEGDWTGHEDMLNYIINDLDVYFGRETGSATWKMQGVEEDPNNPGWPHEQQMIEHGRGLRQWYESEDYVDRHQYESKSNMIMGVNDFTPMYPNLSWYEGFGKGVDGWFVKDNDAATEWVSLYLKHYFPQHEDSIGEELPVYWECYNEPDMNFMNPSFGMIVSSLEKNWEYHKLVAQNVRAKLGNRAPLIGGMTWGQLDLYKPDGIASRSDGQFWYDNSSVEAGLLYDNMLSGVNGWPKAWDNRTDAWWQWDFMYQGFIDYAGADMDFYGVHMYDWPQENENNYKANTRGGGHIEAMLDMFEWYDNEIFGATKDIVLSEFGAVSKDYILSLPTGERDWPFIKSFNQMQMQFLERPSHVVYSMPFAPVKATWGATFSGNNVIRYEGATLMDPHGDWIGDASTWTMNEPTEGWDWSTIIHFFELWKDVEGTRIDTKSSDNDIQVDAYVLGKHVYLILNNSIDEDKTMNLNFFNTGSTNSISNIELRHLYQGDDNIPKYTIEQYTAAPTQVSLKPNSTIVLDYTFANTVTINQESQEIKYMCEPLAGSQTNKRGTQLCHTTSMSSISATVNGVQKPAKGEAIIRVGGFFANPLDGTTGMRVKKLTVNGNPVIVEADNFVANTRGYGMGNYQGAWFGVLELECPVEYLNNGQNAVYFERWQGSEYTTIMIQVFDMTEDPGRTTDGSSNLPPTVNAGNDQTLGVGSTSASLSATASDPDGDALTYSWTLVSGSNVNISGSSSLNASVSGLRDGNTYVLRFSASDSESTSTDDVTITVASNINQAPVANAGSDQYLAAGITSVTLNGSGTDIDGDALTYSWTVVSGSATISNASSVNSTVSGLSDGNSYTFRLTVSDGELNDTDDVLVSINDGNTQTIVIEAEEFNRTGGTYGTDVCGADGFNATTGGVNCVNGGEYAEYDVNVASAGTYQIAYQISTPLDGSVINILDDGNLISTDNVVNNGDWDSFVELIASSTVNLSAGLNVIRLEPGSNEWQWNLDKITLTSTGIVDNSAPIANAGSDQILTAGTTSSSLSGSGTDADGDALSYAWSVVSGSATLINASSSTASVSGLSDGNTYEFQLAVSDGSLSNTDIVQITVNEGTTEQTPYGATAWPIPGLIESVNYDNGGEGIAYHDATTSNTGSGIRQDENVDTEYRIAAGSVGWIAANEWLEYTVNVASAGNYQIDVMVASTGNNGAYHIEFDGMDKTGTQNVSATGGWGTFVTQTITGISLGAGEQVMRMYMDGGSFNLATMTFTIEGGTDPVELTIEAETMVDHGGTFNDGHVPLGVNVNAGVGINWLNQGDWAEYNVNIPDDGAYEIVYNISSPMDGATIDFSVDGTKLNSTAVPNNGGWEDYQALIASGTVNISAGDRVIRLTAETTNWTWNLDKFTLTRVSDFKAVEAFNNVEPLSINIYPNPANGILNIKLNTQEQNHSTILVYNAIGNVVLTQSLTSKREQITIDNLPKGIYILQVKNGTEVIIQRFIKN